MLDLRKLREDKDIKAVVLRVNSPGGSAYGSEQIWREVSLLKEKKPDRYREVMEKTNTLESELEIFKKIADSLTPELIEKIKYEQWNGELPRVQGSYTPIVNMGE